MLIYSGSVASGKSHLLRALASLSLDERFDVLYNGKDTKTLSFEEFQPLRLNIGFASVRGGLLVNRTLRDNLLLPLRYHRIEEDLGQKIVDNALLEFEFQKFQNRLPAYLPFEVIHLASILRALLLQPQVVILDEPWAGLEKDSVKQLLQLLTAYQQFKSDCLFVASSKPQDVPKEIVAEKFQIALQSQATLSKVLKDAS
ncbi:MAG: hypothetical protein COT74_12470 [Bdellovibrionales bacterium CG10_big_fil_rev_8_21_14_0_10_45_34]|nr:MAG: hypothetical protein COT74_12470 [Bdellovibrionales bacterium CG10_big_fil_rev_8_21_14_0_10_45_34]